MLHPSKRSFLLHRSSYTWVIFIDYAEFIYSSKNIKYSSKKVSSYRLIKQNLSHRSIKCLLCFSLFYTGKAVEVSGVAAGCCRLLQVGLLSGWWQGWARGGSPVRVWGGGLATTWLSSRLPPPNTIICCRNLLTNLTFAKFYLLNRQRRRLEQGSITQPKIIWYRTAAPVYVSWQLFFARNEESVGWWKDDVVYGTCVHVYNCTNHQQFYLVTKCTTFPMVFAGSNSFHPYHSPAHLASPSPTLLEHPEHSVQCLSLQYWLLL